MKHTLLLIILCAFWMSCSTAPAPPRNFPFYRQTRTYDCAPTALRMIYAYYGEQYSQDELMRRLKTTKKGTSLKAMYDLSNELGFTTMLVTVNIDFLTNGIKLPCIVDWNNNHAIVVYKVDSTKIYVADPADTLIAYDRATFMKSWLQRNIPDRGIALVIYKL